MKPEKKYISKKLDSFYLYDFEKSFVSVIETLVNYLDEYREKEYRNLKFSEHYDYNDEKCLILTGERLETDKEFNKRIKMEEKQKLAKQKERKAKKEKEYREYLRLKRKFENEK